ncbi:hypothetical protein B9Z51_11665 [Limnohabitans sp. T6-5]|uniref:hypothetical protein n=1 Tax=Limnohabitans sp. T6-5 TaxID=1100724 RepID=UPI000D342652|nr:hypothetical protein [Limnohabitans sp. T6-5]PUE09504.1 hypothetical protein B9Z51_11665 [Limnohabitans sp. T6-5]
MSDKMQDSQRVEPHRLLLNELINEINTREIPYYARAQKFHYVAWHVAATLTFAASIVSAAFAALLNAEQFAGVGRTWLVVLPLIGAATAGAMRLYKFREKEALREDGRIEAVDILRNAKSLNASASDDASCKIAYHSIRARMDKLERDQHRRDIALRTDERVRLLNESDSRS